MIFEASDLINFLSKKYADEKIVVLFDENKNIEFIDKLSKNVNVCLEEEAIKKESVRCVVSFGKNIICKKPVLFFAKDVNQYFCCGENIAIDFFNYEKLQVLTLASYFLNCIYNFLCEQIFLGKKTNNQKLFEVFNVLIEAIKSDNQTKVLEYFDILKKYKIKEYEFKTDVKSFETIVITFLNFKLCEKFLVQKPFCEVLNVNSYSNKNKIFYCNYYYLNYKNNEVCFRLNEFYLDYVSLTFEFGKYIKEIFTLYKRIGIESCFVEIEKLNAKKMTYKLIKNCETPKFCLINVMNKLGLI